MTAPWTTAGDFCRRFAVEDVVTLMEAINSVRPRLWAGRGRDLLGPVAYLDVDGTLAPTTGSKKAGMDISYKGIWGYHPLIVTLANTREVLYLVNRPGNVPSHTDAAGWINKAIDLVAPHAPRVCLRGDTDFCLTAHFDDWAERVDFVFGMDNSTPLRTHADALPETAWRRLHRRAPYTSATGQVRARRQDVKQTIVAEREDLDLRLHHEDVAEFPYRPGKCARPYRVIALRKNISRARLRMLLEALEDDLRAASGGKTEHERCPRNLTVEHVLPQSWQTHWPLPEHLADDPVTAARAAAGRSSSGSSVKRMEQLTS